MLSLFNHYIKNYDQRSINAHKKFVSAEHVLQYQWNVEECAHYKRCCENA